MEGMARAGLKPAPIGEGGTAGSRGRPRTRARGQARSPQTPREVAGPGPSLSSWGEVGNPLSTPARSSAGFPPAPTGDGGSVGPRVRTRARGRALPPNPPLLVPGGGSGKVVGDVWGDLDEGDFTRQPEG